jgi:hypothetical protein
MRATARLSDFALELEAPGDAGLRVWKPKFLASIQGRMCYTSHLGEGTIGFAGWMPYELRQWPIALDKIAFKRYAIAHDIATPAACFDPALIQGPFLIKQATSSFGEGIRGPYRAFDAGDSAQQLQAGEYYENFVIGLIAKAWCWGEECFAVHLHRPSIVTGDGHSTLQGLVSSLPNRDGKHDWSRIEILARYAGIASLEEVMPPGKEVVVEFRYGSRYDGGFASNPNQFEVLSSRLTEQIARASCELAKAASEPTVPEPSLYTLDAMIDAAGTIQFLEMNCNPLMHPDGYGAVLRGSLVAPAATEQDAECPLRVVTRT